MRYQCETVRVEDWLAPSVEPFTVLHSNLAPKLNVAVDQNATGSTAQKAEPYKLIEQQTKKRKRKP